MEAAANNLGINKPFLLEEFGMSILDPDDTDLAYPNDDGGRNAPVRDSYFRSAYEGEFLFISVWAILLTSCFVCTVALSQAKNGRLSGTLFWHWYDRGVGPGKYGVRSNDSTFKLIVEHAEAMNAITGAPRYCAA